MKDKQKKKQGKMIVIKSNRKNERAITLIALVVTIVVLLILAGVSINMLTGENGIIKKSQESKIETKVGEIKEEAEIIRGEYVTNNIGKQPTAEHIINELINRGKITSDEVVDYGQATGIGILNVENRIIEITGELPDIALQYDIITRGGYKIIRLYPKIKTSDTYGDYAISQIQGKTYEEIYQMFVEGANYWNEVYEWGNISLNNIDEFLDVNGYSNIYDFVYTEGYNNFVELANDWAYINPKNYTGDYNIQIQKDFSLICSDGTIYNGNTYIPYYEYIVYDSGIYEFTLQAEEKEVKVSINVEITTSDSEIIDWDSLLVDATKNTDKYIHPDQSDTNGDIGIGTDGKAVNMDLWIVSYSNTYGGYILGQTSGYGAISGYNNANIVDGKIIGEIPQYVMPDGETMYYPIKLVSFAYCESLITAPKMPETITSMEYTFSGCTGLTTAPMIPDSVTDLSGTFSGCISLISAPVISSSVTDLTDTFYGCTNLTGIIEINANPIYYASCFTNASTSTDENVKLYVTGTSSMLDSIIETKSTDSKIEKLVTE